MNMLLKSLAGAIALAGIAATTAVAQDREGWPNNLIIGTGSQGGAYFTYGSGFGTLAGELLGLSASVEITGGPVQNVTLVQTGDHNMGFVTMGPAYEAFIGKSELMPGTPHTAIRALFPMYQTPLQAAVLASSGIKSFADMEGKRIGVGPATGTSATYWQRYFDSAGMREVGEGGEKLSRGGLWGPCFSIRREGGGGRGEFRYCKKGTGGETVREGERVFWGGPWGGPSPAGVGGGGRRPGGSNLKREGVVPASGGSLAL